MNRRLLSMVVLGSFCALQQTPAWGAPQPVAAASVKSPELKPNRIVKLAAVVEETLAGNGLKMVLLEQPQSRIVDVHLVVRAAPYAKTLGETLATADLVAHLISEGTQKRSRAKIDDELNLLGSNLDTEVTADATELWLHVMPGDTEKALDLLADLVAHSLFPQGAYDKQLQLALEQAKQPRSIETKMEEAGARLLFPGEPTANAGVETLIKITREQVVEYWRQNYRPSQMTLVVSGPVRAADVKNWVTRYFNEKNQIDKTQSAAPSLPPAKMPEAKDARAISVIKVTPAPNAMVLVEWRLPPRKDAATMGLALVGELLEYTAAQRGLAAHIDGYGLASTLSVENKVARENVAGTLKEILDAAQRIRAGATTLEQLQAAKRHLEGDFLLTLGRPGGLAQLESIRQIEGLPLDYWANFQQRLAALTLDDVKKAASYLVPEQAAIVVTGDEALGAQLGSLGKVTVLAEP